MAFARGDGLLRGHKLAQHIQGQQVALQHALVVVRATSLQHLVHELDAVVVSGRHAGQHRVQQPNDGLAVAGPSGERLLDPGSILTVAAVQ